MTMHIVLFGTLLTVLGALMQGSFVAPMRLTSDWRWENIWLVYSFVGLLLFPVAVAAITVPQILSVYRFSSTGSLLSAGLFGCSWGFANVLFGLAVAAAGMSVSFSIVCGLSASLGAFLPLVVLTPQHLLQPSGLIIVAGVMLALSGVSIIGVAGHRREREQSLVTNGRSMRKGILLAIAAGTLAPTLNFSYAFGQEIMQRAREQGATAMSQGDALWAVCLAGGFVSNAAYAAWKLARNRSWAGFIEGSRVRNWVLTALMGVLFTGGLLLYGRGATTLGTLGPVVGWPVFQATMVLTSTCLGLIAGEWKNAGSCVTAMLGAGLLVLIGAILVLSLANNV